MCSLPIELEHCLACLACEPGNLQTLIEPTYSGPHVPLCLYPHDLTMRWLQAGQICQIWSPYKAISIVPNMTQDKVKSVLNKTAKWWPGDYGKLLVEASSRRT